MLTLKITQDTNTPLPKNPPNPQKPYPPAKNSLSKQVKNSRLNLTSSYIKQGKHFLVKLKESLGNLGKSVFLLCPRVLSI